MHSDLLLAYDYKNREPVFKIGVDKSQEVAVGDGVADDTKAIQYALTHCSNKGIICQIPKDKTFLVKGALYIWGGATLVGPGSIVYEVSDVPYLLNVGISGRHKLEEPFHGKIEGVRFKLKKAIGSGRLIYFWRTNGAEINNNNFDLGHYKYSATSSGNNHSWVRYGNKNCIRKNLIVKNNTILANATWDGSEGIGVNSFDGVVVTGNKIYGVGDDPIGVHFSDNVKVTFNDMTSTDGRIYVSNSKNVEISHNVHARIPSLFDGDFYQGISLLYIGAEILSNNSYQAPTNINIQYNKLKYPKGAMDAGAAIYLNSPRNVMVKNNFIENHSSQLTATALHILPVRYKGKWDDPDDLDMENIGRVGKVLVQDNVSKGTNPLPMIMTGMCSEYRGGVEVKNNIASKFTFYCSDKVIVGPNLIVE